jgi:putative Mg2+ transporter-C (MgtC) family protein
MPLYPAWWELALRLGSAILAGILIGLDRGERGRPAGLRTMVLVCCAACLSMMQVNLLLPLAGKPPGSFNTLDLMRLPLGILSGMGFIGAGAILRKGDVVRGVTTAATLWVVTVLGLCFGGGQMALGYSGLAVSLGVVRGLRYVEGAIEQEHHARLTMVAAADGPTESNVRARLERSGYEIASCRMVRARDGWRVSWQVSWRGKHGDTNVPALVDTLSADQGVVQVVWLPEAFS